MNSISMASSLVAFGWTSSVVSSSIEIAFGWTSSIVSSSIESLSWELSEGTFRDEVATSELEQCLLDICR